ncbi:MAG: protein kinase [Gemmataceae bacterium]
MIAFPCPHCGHSIRVGEQHAGKCGQCPKCSHQIRIPVTEPPAVTTEFQPTADLDREKDPALTEDSSKQFTVPAFSSMEDSLPEIPGYTIQSELGRGGMGVVYLAHQQALDRPVAIKTVNVSQTPDENLIARFEKEAISLAQLRHPNVVVAYDFGRRGTTLYLVMELLDGMDLEHYISEQGPLDEFTTWHIVRQAASGLAHAAQAGLIHRDIKPGNLFMTDPPEGSALPDNVPHVKVTDFGLVQLQGDIDQAKRLTQAGSVVGTPLFMAPEQIRGTDLDWRCDIYALGMTAINMLLGEAPYRDRTVWEVVTDKAQNTVYPLPEHFARETGKLLRKMIAPVPSDRIDNYRDLLQEIDAILKNEGGPRTKSVPRLHRVPPPVDQRRSFSNRNLPPKRARSVLVRLLAIVPGLVVLFGCIAAFYYFSQPPPEVPMDTVGQPRVLFTGKSIAEWTLREGSWKSSTGFEEEAVLAGMGIIQRKMTDWPHYRLTFGLDMKDAERVEVHFGILNETGQDDPLRYVLRIAKEESAVVGQQRGDHGEFTALAPQKSLTPLPSIARPFREVRIERRGPYWYAMVQGAFVGKLQRRKAERPEFRLAVLGGKAHFEEFQLVELASISGRN